MSGTRGDCARADGTADANRENASYHYAASNAFYALFLDPAMVYSCGYFTDWDNNLAAVQYDKLETICRELRLRKVRSRVLMLTARDTVADRVTGLEVDNL